MSFRPVYLTLLLAAAATSACGKKKEEPFKIQTAAVERRTIIVQAEATGIIEPINVVEVKSRSSGQITEMPVETGTLVRPGALIVQLDTRDVQNQFDQSKADLEAAQKSLEVAEQNKKRSDDLFKGQIITAQENEQAGLTYQNALSQIVRARTNLDLAQQRLDDARVVAPVMGTIIEKPVALGQVIQSGTSAVGGGTTIVKMADLTKVRARAMVNETDIGRVTPGQEATVVVDAFPDRTFRGTIEKIEPQAVVQQNVTMFPVLVSLENRDGLLLPGMNGEVSIISDRRNNVIAVPNEAIRSMREAAQAAMILGLNPDSVTAQIRAGIGAAGGAMAAAAGNGTSNAVQMPQVTDAQCKAITAARTAKPAAAKKVDDLTARMRDPNADRQQLMTDLRAAYTELGVDMTVARACRMRESGGTAGAGGAASRAGRSATRTGLVFVQKADSTWEPRMVRLSVADYDFTEVVSGLQEGERVALLSAAALQMQRQESNERFRAMTGGGSPLGGGSAPASGSGRPAGGAPSGGAPAGGPPR